MAISLYFGLPGVGKTTMMSALALKAVKGKTYKNVYCNIHIAVPGVIYIDNECVGVYDMHDALILIDEATLFADSRDYKSFPRHLQEYMLQHRHYSVDIIFFTQQWDSLDRRIRVITDRVFYVYKDKLLGRWFTRCYPIPYGIIIPDPKKDGSEKLGEIVQGYAKPNFLIRLFSPWLYRPRYYKYFDSWERRELPPLPEKYSSFTAPIPESPPVLLENGDTMIPYFDKNGNLQYKKEKKKNSFLKKARPCANLPQLPNSNEEEKPV